jgi:AhpD family alkylhydroperoxidase
MTGHHRVDISQQDPAAYKALITLSTLAEDSAARSGLDPLLVELVKLRASQINGCAFCLRLHTRDALKKGETTDRLAVLSAWAETGYFSDRERAALRLTEAITRVQDGHVSDEDYSAAAVVLTDEQISAVGWLATVMNAFNRIAITSRYRVAGPVAAGTSPAAAAAVLAAG